MGDNQDYFDKDGLVEYLDIKLSTYYNQKLWLRIPNTKFGKTRIFNREVVDWYMLQNSGEDLEDNQIYLKYSKYVKEKNKPRAAPEKNEQPAL